VQPVSELCAAVWTSNLPPCCTARAAGDGVAPPFRSSTRRKAMQVHSCGPVRKALVVSQLAWCHTVHAAACLVQSSQRSVHCMWQASPATVCSFRSSSSRTCGCMRFGTTSRSARPRWPTLRDASWRRPCARCARACSPVSKCESTAGSAGERFFIAKTSLEHTHAASESQRAWR